MIKAKLFVLGTERELLCTDLEYYRILNNKTGRSGPIPMGGLVTFSFMSGYNDDRLLRWMTHSEEDKFCTLTECKIVFYEGDLDEVSLFEYKYNDAALVYWKETFNSVGDEPMTVTMTISAAIQKVKGKTWVKTWQESWVPPSEQMPYQAVENKEGRIKNFYITDTKGNENPKYKVGDIILANIKSVNKIGDTIDISIKNKTKDFKYKGEILPNDTLANYNSPYAITIGI